MSADGEERSAADLFSLPADGENEPREIAARLIEECPEFEHLRVGEAVIMFVMREESKVTKGRLILGEIGLPKFQGSFGTFALWLLAKTCGGSTPDFIMILDAISWRIAGPLQREALVYHELCHAIHAVDKDGELKFDDDGLPVWGLTAHDIEEFNAVVRRYGAWAPDIHGFIAALREGRAI